MAQISLHGEVVNTVGELPKVGSQAPDFALVQSDLSLLNLSDLNGKKIILNIYISVDTPTCAASSRKFNEAMNGRKDVVTVCVAADLPFAFARFCAAEGLENIICASTFRSPEFGLNYGLSLVDGSLQGLLTRAVVVIDEFGQILHSELVPDIGQEPDYTAALATLS